MKKEILKQLKSDYERLEIKPSDDLWDKLDLKLNERPETSLQSSFQWWKYAAVVLLFISVGSVIYFFNYKTKFNYKETDYMVKKTLKKTVNPTNADLQNQSVISNDQTIKENKEKGVSGNPEKINSDKVLMPQKQKEISVTQVTEYKEQLNNIFKQPENTTINQVKIENVGIPNSPVIADTKKSTLNYINPDELLLGRDFDKAREQSNKDERKLGAFKFDKVIPNVGNVTVLGVTVYLESK